MTEFQKAFLWFALWEGVAIALGVIAIQTDKIFPAFLCGALLMSALGDLSDRARAIAKALPQEGKTK